MAMFKNNPKKSKRQYKIELVKKKIKNKLAQERTKYSKQKMVRSKLRKC